MININWSTLILQIVNFSVMVFILTRFFFKPVVRILDERSKRVTSALDEAEQREREAAEMHAEYEQRLAEAQEQVIVMRQQAQEELEQTKRRLLSETRDEIQTMRERAEREIEEARQEAIYQHRRELGYLATTLSGRLMREAGGNAFQKASTEQFLEQLSALPDDQYRHALEASESEVVHVQLVSAHELDADSASQLERQVQEMAGKPIEVAHKVDPALVAGATIRFGDVVIDGSMAGQLQRLSERYVTDLEHGRA